MMPIPANRVREGNVLKNTAGVIVRATANAQPQTMTVTKLWLKVIGGNIHPAAKGKVYELDLPADYPFKKKPGT
jgi:hypothetical protein